MRESDGGAQPHYLYLVNNYSILDSNGSQATASLRPRLLAHSPYCFMRAAWGFVCVVCDSL